MKEEMMSKSSTELKPQTPAEGILKKNDWGDAKMYHVVCDCGQPDHEHSLWVEADETGISVTIYATVGEMQSPIRSLANVKTPITITMFGLKQTIIV